MSTILDALRKVEGEQRARTIDARSRLLLSSPLSTFRRPRQRRTTFFIGIGLAFTGSAVGAGAMLWRSSPQLSEQQPAQQQRARDSRPEEKPASQLPSAVDVPPGSPAPPAQALAPSASTPEVPVEPHTQLLTPEEPQERYARMSPDVQRSPFLAALQAARENAAASQSPTSTQKTPNSLAGADLRGYDNPSLPPVQDPQGGAIEFPPAEVGTLHKSADGGQAWSSTPVRDQDPASASLSFLQWSSEPSKRIAFLKINGGPLTLAQEGDTVGGFTVVEIRRDGVELRSGNSSFTLQTK